MSFPLVSWFGLRSVIVAIPGHTHLRFVSLYFVSVILFVAVFLLKLVVVVVVAAAAVIVAV